MTPDQCKKLIAANYALLLKRVQQGEVNANAVESIVEGWCMEAARHNGVPECWRDYMPD